MARKMKKGKDLLRSAVEDYVIKHDDIKSIFLNMANSGGFESRNLAEGVDILRMMIDEQNCTKFLSFVGALMSTGARGIIRDMVKNKMCNVLVPMDNYGPLIEEKVQKCLRDMYNQGKRNVGTYEITDYVGSTLDKSSFLFWAHKNKIPVIVPGIVDGAVGS